jgi:hypothetical protein
LTPDSGELFKPGIPVQQKPGENGDAADVNDNADGNDRKGNQKFAHHKQGY